jgi:DNA-binding transcriptional LysR family regulator
VLDLYQLHALHAVATCGSIRGAADNLHVTTSAISQRLTKLEADVGQRLLERHGRGVKLTEAAKLLVDHAERILSMVHEAEAAVEAHRGAVSGPLTIAAFPSAARGLLLPALSALRAEHPNLHATLRELEPDEALGLVVRGDVDVAVVQDWFNAPLKIPGGLVRAPLLDDTTDVALPAAHPLAGRDTVGFDEIAPGPWVSWPPGSICHDWLVHTLRTHGVEPRVTHTAGEHSTQLALVAAGFGTALIPRLGKERIPEGVLLAAVSPTLKRHVYAVWRSETTHRPAVRAAVSILGATAVEPEFSLPRKR